MNAIVPAARTRTPPSRANAPASGSGPTANIGWMKRGSVARAVTEQEVERQQQRAEERARQRRLPFRYWLPVGGQGDIVILDHELGPCIYEHELENKANGRFEIHEACPKEWEPCPLCEGAAGGRPSNYIMFLTVIDMLPRTNRTTGVTIPHSRKLLAIKPSSHGFFYRLADRHGGDLRGVQLLMTRDTKQSPNHGNPEEVAKHSEEVLVASFGHDEVKDQQGKVIKARNADLEVIPYDELFVRPSAADLRARYGGTAPIGSRAANAADDDGWGAHDPGRATASAAALTGRTTGVITPRAARTPNQVSPDMDDEIPF
jgi:hypothetical protein